MVQHCICLGFPQLTHSPSLCAAPLQDAESTSSLPLRSSVVQRLQRFATYGHLKQVG